MGFITEIGVVLLTIYIAVLMYLKWCYKYWERKSVPYIKPKTILANGSESFLSKKNTMEVVQKAYDYFKSIGTKHGGIYMINQPVYMPINLDMVKNILTKDFQHFTNHGIGFDEKGDPLSAHLFNLEDGNWKNMRAKLTPTFTSGKMKMMFQTLVDCGDQMKDHLDKCALTKSAVDIKEILACYTTDIIGSCAFGLECNSFNDSSADFRKNGRRIFKLNFIERMKFFISFNAPQLFNLLKLSTIPKDASTFFLAAIANVVNYRLENNVSRNDFVQILMELKKKSESEGKKFTLDQMAAQSFVFFLAGFETSSTTMTFCLYELATQKNIQQKLREEINKTLEKYDGKLTYDGIMEMKYMNQVVNETLRKYPPVGILNRICTKDYKVPDTEILIEKGTKVFISALGVQRDPEYYPNPDKFDPERFSDENVAKRNPYTFLPFGEGPRICIGLRFGLMQTKVGLSLLLKHYLISLNAKTKVPMEFDGKSFILSINGDLWLDFEKLHA